MEMLKSITFSFCIVNKLDSCSKPTFISKYAVFTAYASRYTINVFTVFSWIITKHNKQIQCSIVKHASFTVSMRVLWTAHVRIEHFQQIKNWKAIVQSPISVIQCRCDFMMTCSVFKQFSVGWHIIVSVAYSKRVHGNGQTQNLAFSEVIMVVKTCTVPAVSMSWLLIDPKCECSRTNFSGFSFIRWAMCTSLRTIVRAAFFRYLKLRRLEFMIFAHVGHHLILKGHSHEKMRMFSLVRFRRKW